ncbi:NAD-binding protein [Halalkaliarchaeum sp. AArc-GB]|uniref:potassium channel family protein n=1 Tax=Halalkaliarchaeum sp. AArc-GB TaxID=3074078 RepID=UPI00285B87F9|nr:NAD-binding protein [Halalkaliarchaeum sp. AArc-GB]MDR5674746.1 NAD-binding protein [Halalkaliarchaeum sp. AArc-GB]
MNGLKRRIVSYMIVLGVALIVTSLGYQWGMATYEDRPRTFLDSLQFTVEMFTTTGFGGDSPWESPQMHTYIIVTDLLGMALLVGALPVVATPLLQSVLSSSAPEQVDEDLTDHVVICSDTTRSEVLINELDSREIPYVIVEPDRDRADELYKTNDHVIKADPASTNGLEAAKVASARAVVADVSDQVDASIVLTAKEVSPDVSVISVVEDPDNARYHEIAGADHVLSPRSLIGRSLSKKVTSAMRTEIDESVAIGDELRLAEISIRHGSALAGTTLAESNIREESGVTVIGVWVDGRFNPAPGPKTRLPPGTVLLASGRTDQLEQLVEMTQSTIRGFKSENVVIVGYGQVGRSVRDELDKTAITYTLVDKADTKGIDVVGDATEPEILTEAGIEDADTVVLALPDDNTTEFATLMIRDLAPDTEIIARVNQQENVSKTYRAGADYVLSLTNVTGRMIASRIFEDRDLLSLEQQVKVIRERAPQLVGQSLAEANVRDRTGCIVIGLERGSTVITDIGPQTTFEPEDELIIVGADDGIRAFEQAFC